ncbi:hypothetical protein Tco_0606097 [Tanacetum coccineum]
MAALKFAETHNLAAFLSKPKESDGFEQIVDFLNANPINYALTIQALVDGKKVIITEASVRRDLQLADENGTECLPNATIFAELERMRYEKLTQKLTFYKAFFAPQWKFLIHTILKCLSAKTTAWNEFSSIMASAIICLATNQNFNFSKYIFDNMVKNLEGGVKFLIFFANMKREEKGFSGRVTPLFQTMLVQAQEEGEGSVMPTVPQHTPTINQPLSSQPQKKQKTRKSKKQNIKVPQPSDSTEPIADEAPNDENVTTHSNDLLLSGEDRLKLNELMKLCTNLSQRVLDLENTKTSQDAEITELKERVKKLKRRNKSRTTWLKRLRKVGGYARIESSEDKGLGDQEDASKQGRKIVDIDADEEEFEVEKVVSTAKVTTASATTTTIDELTLVQILIEIKAAKPKAVTTAATTTTAVVTRPKARGVIVQEPSEFTTTTSPSQSSQLPQAKDKGNAKIIEPEKPLKQKDQIMYDQEVALNLQAQLQVELEEEERLAMQREEDASIDEWDNVQAMIDADYELAARLQAQEQEELQAEEQGELTIEERSKLFVELMDKRKKHFAKLRAEEIRRKPPTKAQKRNQMCTYLKNMANYKHSQLKNKSFEEIQMLFDNTMKWVDSFVPMDSEVVEENENVKLKWNDEANEKAYSGIVMMMIEDLETLWKLVKAKHGNTRPEEAYERMLWGDLKVMFEQDVESKVWRNQQGYNVTV